MHRNRNVVVVTTTVSLEGYETQHYLGVVSAHVVAGTGLFSDVFASFSDIFGGRSRSYQKQLASINDEVVELLKQRALARGGNCILGLRIDHDSISGGGKSMFMVTATGTAVVAKRLEQSKERLSGPSAKLSADDLGTLTRRQQLIEDAENDGLLLEDKTWDFLCANQVHEVAPTILAGVERAPNESWRFPDNFIDRSKTYFRSLPDETVKELLYPELMGEEKSMQEYAHELLSEMNLLDLDEAESMLRSDDFEIRKRALSLLQLDKVSYSEADIEKLETLRETVETSFGKRGQVIEVNRLLSSIPAQKWTCECGSTMNMDLHNCTKCGRDVYGFAKNETQPGQVAQLLGRKIEIFKSVFSNGGANPRKA